MPPFWAPCPPSQIAFPSSLKLTPILCALSGHCTKLWACGILLAVLRHCLTNDDCLFEQCPLEMRGPSLSAFTHQLSFDLPFKISRLQSDAIKKTPLTSIPTDIPTDIHDVKFTLYIEPKKCTSLCQLRHYFGK